MATDVAARGLDINDIDVVIQIGCRNLDSFVHRSGRTGRVDKKGLNIMIQVQSTLHEQEAVVEGEDNENKVVHDFMKDINKKIPSSMKQIVEQLKDVVLNEKDLSR